MIKTCLPAGAAMRAFRVRDEGTAEKRYPMQGVVKAVDPAAKMATIDAGKIDDWMDAMTMEYPVKPDSELAKLHAGDHIEATVVVDGGIYYVTDVKVVPK
jgi:Cu/Ag efflux protein CusF